MNPENLSEKQRDKLKINETVTSGCLYRILDEGGIKSYPSYEVS